MRSAFCRAHVREQSDHQFVIRGDKDGTRFDITGVTKLKNDLATLELRRSSVFHGGRWQATSAGECE
jgi:hypothetical protein